MPPIQLQFVGLAMFLAQFIIAEYLLKLLAIKTANTGFGKGLGALVF